MVGTITGNHVTEIFSIIRVANKKIISHLISHQFRGFAVKIFMQFVNKMNNLFSFGTSLKYNNNNSTSW
jgi:hypothetical protein